MNNELQPTGGDNSSRGTDAEEVILGFQQPMLFRFCLYGFLKNQRYFEPYFMLALLAKDLSYFSIGLLYAGRWLTLNVFEIPSGVLADHWGRRKCMITSFVAYVASFILFAFASSFFVLSIGMILFGIGDSFRTGTHKAMIFQWLRLQGRESERTEVYGLTRSWSQFGSATSAILAGLFLVTTGDFQHVFLLAALPYALNIINFLGYPEELDGDVARVERMERVPHLTVLRTTLRSVWREKRLRSVLLESVAWEGIFNSVRDYLQPALLALILSYFVLDVGVMDFSLEAKGQSVAQGVEPVVVLVISAVYAILFFLSGWASRGAHRLVAALGSARMAAGGMWLVSLTLYAVLTVASFGDWKYPVVAVFVLLAVLENLWRPILVSRIDEYSDSAYGATVLSVESGLQRLATMVMAPLVGLAVDNARYNAGMRAFVPIGLIGMASAFLVLLTKYQSTGQSTADCEQ